MNYQKIYDCIILNAKCKKYDDYIERHHILPKCLGGNNSSKNIIKFSAREHYICHWLLTKIYKDTPQYSKLLTAFMRMHCVGDTQKRYINSRAYDTLKKEYSRVKSTLVLGKDNPTFGCIWVHNDTLQQSKFAKPEELDDLYNSGWEKGRICYGLPKKITMHDKDGNAFQKPLEELNYWMEHGFHITYSTKKKYFTKVYKDGEYLEIYKIDLNKYLKDGYIECHLNTRDCLNEESTKYFHISPSVKESIRQRLPEILYNSKSWGSVAKQLNISIPTLKKLFKMWFPDVETQNFFFNKLNKTIDYSKYSIIN